MAWAGGRRQGAIALHLFGFPEYLLLLTSRYPPPSFQGPIRIGAGCFVSGLDIAHSEALHGLELHDLILQGHHVRLHGSLSRVFTLAGRLDSWEVGIYLTFLCLHLKTLGSPQGSGSILLQGSLNTGFRDRLGLGGGQTSH